MINSINFIRSSIAVAIIAMLSSVTMVSAQSAFDVPSCDIYAVPSSISSMQTAVLSWTSTAGAVFASLDNGIGDIAPDGQMVVAPNYSTVYTMHTWNGQGEGGYCSVGITVDGNGVFSVYNAQPNVTLQTLGVYPALSQVSLGNVPYTGTKENIIYTLFLFSVLITVGYVATMRRKTVLA